MAPNYERYLRSGEWTRRRLAALEYAQHRCQVCNSRNRPQVHHRTYERLGDERPADLTVLCQRCHRLFHQVVPEPRKLERMIKEITLKAAAPPSPRPQHPKPEEFTPAHLVRLPSGGVRAKKDWRQERQLPRKQRDAAANT